MISHPFHQIGCENHSSRQISQGVSIRLCRSQSAITPCPSSAGLIHHHNGLSHILFPELGHHPGSAVIAAPRAKTGNELDLPRRIIHAQSTLGNQSNNQGQRQQEKQDSFTHVDLLLSSMSLRIKLPRTPWGAAASSRPRRPGRIPKTRPGPNQSRPSRSEAQSTEVGEKTFPSWTRGPPHTCCR
jgi:hypothetical protein